MPKEDGSNAREQHDPGNIGEGTGTAKARGENVPSVSAGKDESSSAYSVTAGSLFSFLKQTFFKMPAWVQVFGWLTFLALFVFLVLYPVVGICYVEGHMVDITRDPTSGKKKMPSIKQYRVHRDRTVTTNEDGEFTLPVRGPLLPGTSVQFTFGDGDYQGTIDVPAPLPFVSLFNPNPRTIYRVLSSDTIYFTDYQKAVAAFNGDDKTKNGRSFLTPAVVHADSKPIAPYVVHIRQMTLPKGMNANDVYFVTGVNGQGVQIDTVPDSKSPSSRLLTVSGDRPIQIEGFDIPVTTFPARVEIELSSKRLLSDTLVAKFSTTVQPPSPDQLARPITITGTNMTMTYDLLPPVPIGCVGINSAKAVELLRFIFWLDVSDADRSTIKSVQYHLGPNFSSKSVAAPQISPADKWSYSIAAYAPEVVKATVTFTNGVVLQKSKLCRADREGTNTMTLFALSQAYRFDDQYKLSAQYADKALAADPNFAPALVNKAIALAHQKNPPDIYQMFQRARQLAPASPYVLSEFAGYVVEGLNKPTPAQLKEGLEAADAAVTAEPSPGNLDTLGWLNYRMGNYAEATKVLQLAASEQQTSRANSIWQTINYHLGMTFVELNRDAEAVEAFREVAEFAKFDISNKQYAEDATRQLSKLTGKGGKR